MPMAFLSLVGFYDVWGGGGRAEGGYFFRFYYFQVSVRLNFRPMSVRRGEGGGEEWMCEYRYL